MSKTTIRPASNLLLEALYWVREAGDCGNAQRAISVRSNGDGTFGLKRFENAGVKEEHSIGCKADLDELLGQLFEQLVTQTNRTEVSA